MKNAYLRFGWLTYVKSTEKTTTSIKLRLDRFIGEMLPDPPRQAKAHLISQGNGQWDECEEHIEPILERVSYQSMSDPAAISEYAKLARTALEALGGRVIVADKPAKTHEAGVQQLVVVVEFENLEKAIAAYESDRYKPALKVFDNAAQRDFRIVEGR
jgi:uncharacterized protein (DUF1330 family)